MAGIGLGIGVGLGIGGRSAFKKEASDYFKRMTVQWDGATKKVINNFIAAQLASGLWDAKDRIFLPASTSAADSVLDLKGIENCELVNSPTFTAARGVTANTGTYINSKFNPVSDGSNYKFDDLLASVYINTNSIGTVADIGHDDGVRYFRLRARSTDDKILLISPYQTGTASTQSDDNITTSVGFYSVQRMTNATSSVWKDGTKRLDRNVGSAALVNNEIYIGALNLNGTPSSSSGRQYSYAELGGSLSDELMLENYNQVNTLLTHILAL
jgi:hypothetical protein